MLTAQGSGVTPVTTAPAAAYAEVDTTSLELTQPRSIGVEHVALAAMRDLEFESLLSALGINGVMRAATLSLSKGACRRGSGFWSVQLRFQG